MVNELKNNNVTETPRILWVDDKIFLYSEIIEILEENGLIVDTASSAEEALDKDIEYKKYDLYIVDIRMPEIDGLGFIRRIQKRKRLGKLVVLSSYLYQDKFKAELERSTMKMFILEKRFAQDTQLIINDFVKPIKEWINTEPKLNPKEYFRKSEEFTGDVENPLLMHFDKFISLPETERMRLADKVEQDLSKMLSLEFSKGNIWVLICGDKNEPTRTARNIQEIPSDNEILNIAKARNTAFYEFTAPIGAESFSWNTECDDTASYSNYPTLNIILSPDNNNNIKKTNIRVHFDTGSPETFFSYEKLLDIGKKVESSSIKRGRRTETSQVYKWIKYELNFLIQNDLNEEEQVAIHLTVQAVKNWDSSPWIKLCPVNCSKGIVNGGNSSLLCINRHALVGNNIFQDNDIIIELHAVSKSTSIRRSDIDKS